jgi:4-hydroxysphinganine ceramide fatty acyl 2-hydroxylase
MNDDASHFHSEAAYEILEECFIGHVLDGEIIHEATDNDGPSSIVPIPDSISPKNSSQGAAGTSGQPVSVTTAASFARDFNVEINPAQSQKQPKFLDLNRPLLMQVFNGGFSKKFYLEQVHRPRHREGGASAPLFGNFLEPLSLTPWWVVPTVWLPPMIFGTILASKHLGLATVGYWTLGIFIWTLIEYSMHRFLFHIDK